MKIEIKKNVYLEADKNQYVIKKYTGKFDEETGKELFTTLGFYGHLSQAVKKLFKLKLSDAKVETLEELIAEIKKQNEYIETLFTEGGK